MESTYGMKEIRFDLYCKTCEYEKQTEDKEPCAECLDTAAREYSHKPINWKEKSKK